VKQLKAETVRSSHFPFLDMKMTWVEKTRSTFWSLLETGPAAEVYEQKQKIEKHKEEDLERKGRQRCEALESKNSEELTFSIPGHEDALVVRKRSSFLESV
jgi:hypothetical protein